VTNVKFALVDETVTGWFSACLTSGNVTVRGRKLVDKFYGVVEKYGVDDGRLVQFVPVQGHQLEIHVSSESKKYVKSLCDTMPGLRVTVNDSKMFEVNNVGEFFSV
jgi:hypothetical protein